MAFRADYAIRSITGLKNAKHERTKTMKLFDLYQTVTIAKGPFKGIQGKVMRYHNGKYNIRFGGKGKIVVFCDFRPHQIKR